MLRDLPVFETVIPSKIFEFLAQERPVIARRERRDPPHGGEAEAGLVVDPEDADALVAAIHEVRAQPPEAAARARAGREWVEANFQRDVLARRMAAFLERVCREAA